MCPKRTPQPHRPYSSGSHPRWIAALPGHAPQSPGVPKNRTRPAIDRCTTEPGGHHCGCHDQNGGVTLVRYASFHTKPERQPTINSENRPRRPTASAEAVLSPLLF
jgi:hypothetical protein